MTSRVNPRMLTRPVLRKRHYRRLVGAFYDRVSESYERIWGPSFHFACFRDGESRTEATKATELMVAEYGRFARGMHVLEIGCGIGGPALTIAEETGAAVTGIDLSAVNICSARRRATASRHAGLVSFALADGMSLPFADGSFDGVYEFEAGCHMPDKDAWMGECIRVLRRGGRLVLFDWFAADDVDDRIEGLNEEVCRRFAIPGLVSMRHLTQSLRGRGQEIIALRDFSREGSIAGNWAPLMAGPCSHSAAPGLPKLWEIGPAGRALHAAAAAGTLVIGLLASEKRV
jgi:sterol 24-C-methyltransferase